MRACKYVIWLPVLAIWGLSSNPSEILVSTYYSDNIYRAVEYRPAYRIISVPALELIADPPPKLNFVYCPATLPAEFITWIIEKPGHFEAFSSQSKLSVLYVMISTRGTGQFLRSKCRTSDTCMRFARCDDLLILSEREGDQFLHKITCFFINTARIRGRN